MSSKNKVNSLEEFIKYKESQYSPNTLRNYRYGLLEFESWLQDRQKALPELTAEDLAIYLQEQMKKGLATQTILGKMWPIKTFVKFLWYKNQFSLEEHKAIEQYWPNLPKNEDDRRALSNPELKENLIKLNNPMFRMLFFVGVNYGLRTSEFVNLKVENIDLKKRLVTIHGKGNKIRRVKIIRPHVKEWRNYLRYRSGFGVNHDYVFFTSHGRATNRTIQRYFNKMSELCYGQERKELWFTPHILRFTFATRLYLGEMRLLDISKALGHSSIRTTQIYLRIEEQEALRSYDAQAERILSS